MRYDPASAPPSRTVLCGQVHLQPYGKRCNFFIDTSPFRPQTRNLLCASDDMICLTELAHRGTRLQNTDTALDLPSSRERIPLMRLPAPTSQPSLSK